MNTKSNKCETVTKLAPSTLNSRLQDLSSRIEQQTIVAKNILCQLSGTGNAEEVEGLAPERSSTLDFVCALESETAQLARVLSDIAETLG